MISYINNIIGYNQDDISRLTKLMPEVIFLSTWMLEYIKKEHLFYAYCKQDKLFVLIEIIIDAIWIL